MNEKQTYLDEIKDIVSKLHKEGSDNTVYLKYGRYDYAVMCRAGIYECDVEKGKLINHRVIQGKDLNAYCGFPGTTQHIDWNDFKNYWKYFENGSYRLNFDFEISKFSLTGMPGCCGICVSQGSSVVKEYSNLGIGRISNLMRQQIAWKESYSLLLCTDVDWNIPQKKILKRNKWKQIDSFLNNKTGNKINIHSFHLKDTGRKIGCEKIDSKEIIVKIHEPTV